MNKLSPQAVREEFLRKEGLSGNLTQNRSRSVRHHEPRSRAYPVPWELPDFRRRASTHRSPLMGELDVI